METCIPGFDTKPLETQESIQSLFDTSISNLVTMGYLLWSKNQFDEDVYTPTETTIPANITEMEKTILYCLNANKSIFNTIILYCQFDKSNQQALFMAESIKNVMEETGNGELPIFFVVTENIQNLMDQTKDGFNTLLSTKLGIESGTYEGLLCLKGDEKTSYNDISNYIDSYYLSYSRNRSTKRLPPIILALSNKIQIDKIIRLHKKHVLDEMNTESDWPLRSIFVFDEFDKLYRGLRNTFKPYILDSTKGVMAVLGVTGSENGITEECPEWASSNLVRVELNPEKEANYRGIHHSDAKIKHYKQGSKESNTEYALRIILENKDHFINPRINPRNNKQYFSKTIILGNLRVSSHSTLANSLKEHKIHAVLQNGNGLKVRRHDCGEWKTKSTSKKVLREVLYTLFNEYNLWDAPVVLIGFKKIDRGLGYHYAPPSGGPGLIWTDEIMGLIDGEASRIQRVSRTHGVIAQCDDYPNELWYWIDSRTDITVRNTNSIITELHKHYYGFHPLKERLVYAKKVARIIRKPDDYGAIGETTPFDTYEEAKSFIEFYKQNARVRDQNSYLNVETGKYETSLTNSDGQGRRPYTISEYNNSAKNLKESSLLVPADLESEEGFSYRLMPMYADDEYTDLKWCVRWASTRFICEDGLLQEDVLVRKYPYNIVMDNGTIRVVSSSDS